MTVGQFITFEGPDGAGKSSVLATVIPWLETHLTKKLVVTREPGGVAIAEAIRKVLLDVNNAAMDPRTEALLYAAARRQHLTEKIVPALKANAVVVCDRFVDSSIAYQGAGRQIDEQEIADLNDFATNGLTPDLTIYLDVPAEVGLARISANRQEKQDRLDREAIDFHQRVRASYLCLAATNPERIQVIDATQELSQVILDTETCLQQALKIDFK